VGFVRKPGKPTVTQYLKMRKGITPTSSWNRSNNKKEKKKQEKGKAKNREKVSQPIAFKILNGRWGTCTTKKHSKGAPAGKQGGNDSRSITKHKGKTPEQRTLTLRIRQRERPTG